ncbi:MAG: surface lipoprotein assembly modifier [Sideroxyarcus sp.]
MKFSKLPLVALSGLMFAAGVAHAEVTTIQNDSSKAGVAGESAGARQKLLQDADRLIKAGKLEEAYALLEPEQSWRAGDPDYDYLLGIAALDSGRPTEAIFALERVLAVRPKHLQARAEIARAYFASGENAAAKQEFETVQSQNPPKEVNATIQRFLDAINQGQGGKGTKLNGYLEASIGNDSNVNSATASDQVAIPLFGGAVATLDATGVQTRDSFATVSGGANVRHSLSPDWSVFGGVNLNERKNSSKHIFNTGEMDGNVGLSYTAAEDSYSAALQLQGFNVDAKRYRNASGMTLQWQRDLKSRGSQASSYLQYTNLKYPDQTIRDANRYVLGVAYASMLSGDYAPVVYGGLYAGREKEKQSGESYLYLGHKLLGLRTGGELSIYAQTKLFGSLSIESRRYGGDDPFFLVTRKDTQTDLKVGLNYVMGKLWTLTPQISYTKNKSNIVISDYKRSMISLGLRRDFN